MDIKILISMLAERARRPRSYSSKNEWWFETAKESYKRMKSAGKDGLSGCKPRALKKPDLFEYSDLCIQGGGDQEEVAAELGFPLPDDYRFFCSIFREYLFAGRSILHLTDGASIREEIVGVRQGWDVPDGEPVRLFYFARLPDEPAAFAFRLLDSGAIDIVFSWDFGDLGEPNICGTDGSRFSCDPTFSDWLERMIRTDGFPLVPGGRIPTGDGWIERSDLPPPDACGVDASP